MGKKNQTQLQQITLQYDHSKQEKLPKRITEYPFFPHYPLEKEKCQLGVMNSDFIKANHLLNFLSDVKVNQNKIFQTYFWHKLNVSLE